MHGEFKKTWEFCLMRNPKRSIYLLSMESPLSTIKGSGREKLSLQRIANRAIPLGSICFFRSTLAPTQNRGTIARRHAGVNTLDFGRFLWAFTT